MSDIDRVRSAVSLPDLMREYGVGLRRVPGGYIAKCCFHSERTPSMRVHVGGSRDGVWKCFGCAAAGDCFTFVMKIEGWGFGRALRYLADRYGVLLTGGPPARLESAARPEDEAFLGWINRGNREMCLRQLEAALADGPPITREEYDWCCCLGRLSRHKIESLAGIDGGLRRRYRAEMAREAKFAGTWMECAAGMKYAESLR